MTTQRNYSYEIGPRYWLTVHLLIPSEFNEAVSNFLMEWGSKGIEEIAGGVNRTRLKAYFREDGDGRRILPALRRYLKSLKALHPGTFSCRLHTATLADKNWGEKWKRFFKPVQVTPRIVVKPPWISLPLKKGQTLVEINPGVAFGTGTHASTKLCIQALEQRLRKRGGSFLDVGSGSGILSIIAAKLGAREACGVDPDGASVENARENIARNHVLNAVKIRKGTIGDIGKKFDIVVANIDFEVLRRMRWPLVRHVKAGGLLILSGFLARDKEALVQRYMETGVLGEAEGSQLDEWACLTFKKKKKT